MKIKGLEMAEKIVLSIIDLVEKIKVKLEYWEGVKNKQMELETGVSNELMVLWLKGKVLSIIPEKWRYTANKIML